MPTYTGVLSDSHVRAVARLALQARGFCPDIAAIQGSIAEEMTLARHLVEVVTPARLPELTQVFGVCRDSGRDPIWERLPGMLALGYRQAAMLDALCDDASDHHDEVALLGAVFNAAISTIDYVVDEAHRDTDVSLFTVVDDRLVRAIFTPTDDVAGELSAARSAVRHPAEQLAVVLVAAWARLGVAMVDRTGNLPAWHALGNTLRSLLEAERQVTDHVGRVTAHIEAATRWKSEGPSFAIAQMAALARPPGRPPQEKLWREGRYLGRVFCLVDDLCDIAADARSGRPNVNLHRARRAKAPALPSMSDPELYRFIDDAAAQLTSALNPAPETRPEIAQFATEIAARWLQWDQHPPPPAPPRREVPASAEAAAQLLLTHQAGEYQESAHRLAFPRGTVGATRYETHDGLLFIRATALDALLDAFDSGFPMSWSTLCRDGIRVLQAKHPGVRGGWTYIQTVPELPPDADDLAQVLQVLCRLGGRQLAATCDEAVRLILDAVDDSGGFPTWILDPRSPTPLDAQMRHYVEVVGGTGTHCDVVANLLTGLLVCDPVRYQQPLARSARFLADSQRPDGSWESTWYAGPYYATFRASVVLTATGSWDQHCGRARSFLLRHQNTAGGWDSGEHEPLSTALALLGLCGLDPHGCTDAIASGVDRLNALQAHDGGWPASPWIRFRTQDGDETYGSRTATTAFALKAILAAATRTCAAPRRAYDRTALR